MTKKEAKQTIETEEKTNRNIFQEYSEALVVAVILAILIRALLVQAFKIPSSSMEPTLLVGDHILVSKFTYGIRIPFTDSEMASLQRAQDGRCHCIYFPGGSHQGLHQARDCCRRRYCRSSQQACFCQ